MSVVAVIAGPTVAVGQQADRGAESTRKQQQTLTLRDAIGRAVELNTRLKTARIERSIAKRNVSLGNAGFLPELNAVGVQRHQFGGQGLFGSGAIFTQTEAGLQLSWVAFDGLRRIETYDRLEAEERRERFRTRAEMESVVREVTQAYIELQRARGVLEALVETRDLSEERLSISRARLNAGTGSKVDVNQARVELNGDRSAIASQRVVVREAETRLTRAMGRQPESTFEVSETIDVDHRLSRGELRSVLLEGNYTYRAQKASQSIQEETLSEQKARRWPQLDMGLGYTYTEFHSGIAPEFDAEASLAYNLQLTVPIFRGFNIQRSIKNARSRVAQQDFTVHRQRLLLLEQFEQAWESYERHRERIEMAEESVGLAESNVDVALTQFEAGTIDQVQLRQVQVNLQEARTRLVEARYAARQAELRLMALTGQLYEQAVASQ
jgi:outer membrane protein TolC